MTRATPTDTADKNDRAQQWSAIVELRRQIVYMRADQIGGLDISDDDIEVAEAELETLRKEYADTQPNLTPPPPDTETGLQTPYRTINAHANK